ncbi:hypothetical protein CC86DRAFT_451843 [Ophiobolus disseminans]|uniref:Uncharacterized protein n=1 Tax=Ophiobolus disseminans TaxID=1469910 RepID=A0A6A7AHX0_9PLEO|nr:hypothetical protein CC86DRAFT_451843 [Ophiobolus disseminans]
MSDEELETLSERDKEIHACLERAANVVQQAFLKLLRAAILTHCVCDEAFVGMEPLFKELITGILLDVHYEEVRVTMKEPLRKTTLVVQGKETCNSPGYYHDSVRVTSQTSGKRWYLDLTGSQFGIDEPLWSAEKYHNFVDEVTLVADWGGQSNKEVLEETEGLDPEWFEVRREATKKVFEAFGR